MEFYIAALSMGLLGSFHCIGMCGPIAVALPVKAESWFSKILGGSLYNMGRSVTYGLMGVIFGLVGKGFQLVGLQQITSIVIGILMILSVLFPLLFKNRQLLDRFTNRIVQELKSAFARLFSIKSNFSLFTIGILNGFLPCGLVYMAIAGAIVTGDVLEGTLYMVLFGLGTLPIMLSLTLTSQVISVNFRNTIKKIIPIFIIIIGLLFILRGMNLGIKYVSPKLAKAEEPKLECCH